MVPPRLKVEILVSWLWVKRCVFAGIKKLGWYSVGRVRVSLVLNRFSPLQGVVRVGIDSYKFPVINDAAPPSTSTGGCGKVCRTLGGV